MKTLEDFDKNFRNKNVARDDMKLYNVEDDPFKIYGIYKAEGEDRFRRLPESVAKAANEGVLHLSTNTAGGRVRFKTNSKYVAIKAELPSVCVMAHMPLSGICGFDLYADGHYAGSFIPKFIATGKFERKIDVEGGFEAIVEFPDSKMRDIVINFPLYNDVSNLYIGLSETAVLERGNEYKINKPIVFYGSSITQGGCASRPGCSYQSILSRKFDFDFVNLGFSGSGRAEECMADYVSKLDMSVFVYDYDHNAPNPEHLRKTHYNMYKKVRDAHPDIPIIMLSRPNRAQGPEISERIEIIQETLNRAIDTGDKNISFINGQDIFSSIDSDIFNVDGTHPNSFGFYCMAKALESEFEKIL